MSLDDYLSALQNATLHVSLSPAGDADGTANIVLEFSNGTVLDASYWRLIIENSAAFSSFDHNRKYGELQAFDAKKEVMRHLDGIKCRTIILNEETADLELTLAKNLKLQIFAFTAYEIWRIRFPDGAEAYSNHVR